jgi:hypothetical protein
MMELKNDTIAGLDEAAEAGESFAAVDSKDGVLICHTAQRSKIRIQDETENRFYVGKIDSEVSGGRERLILSIYAAMR